MLTPRPRSASSVAPRLSSALAAAILLAGGSAPSSAQQTPARTPTQAPVPHAPDRVTADDYARAEWFLSSNTSDLVHRASVRPTWTGDGLFWYWNDIPDGREMVLVDPGAPSRERAFDHQRLALALGEAADTTLEAFDLPLSDVDLVDRHRTLRFEMADRPWACDLESYRCRETEAEVEGGEPTRREVVSPDGRKAAFIRDHDLWMRNLETGEETRLTTDGVEDYGYATNNAGWTRSDRPVLRWSPDSRRIATFQHDARGVGMMYLTTTEVGHPELDAWRYPLPEDSVIFRIRRVIIDTGADTGTGSGADDGADVGTHEGTGDGADHGAEARPEVVPLQMPPDPHRSTVCDHVYCGGTFADVEWSDDGTRLAFVSSSRDHQRATLRVADARTGEVRDVLEETSETFLESGHRTANWRFLPGSNEVMWWSRRDDWGHLYMYDLETGGLKHRVTEGDWNVLQVLDVDTEERTVTFIGNEREPGDPYFRYLYRVGMDGSGLELLTPDSADHDVDLAPGGPDSPYSAGEYVVDTYSTFTTPAVTVLRNRSGEEVLMLEEGDISELVDAGWQPPIPFSVKARDGETDLYGVMFRPTHFDPAKKYPVVNYLYPGPQSGSVGSRQFRASHRDHQAIAELGFVVVALDAMGTPMRSKSFHAAYYGDMGDNGLPDQVGGIRQLAERHPWMDVDRVGIWGHSGGGFASTGGILRYPDFYKVAVSQAGNHDNRNYEDDWGEKWQGLLETYPDGTTSYDNQANQLVAHRLEGKLLLAHGTVDDNVPPSNTLLMVNALIEHNKDFDLIMFPNRRHGFGNEPYMMRRRWDYFVEHLLGAEPPEAYEFGSPEAPGGM